MPLAPHPTSNAPSNAQDREFQVYAISGPNASKVVHCRPKGEIWLWQFNGASRLSFYAPESINSVEHHTSPELSNLLTAKLKSDASSSRSVELSKLDSQLIPINTPFSITPQDNESITIAISMVPIKKNAP